MTREEQIVKRAEEVTSRFSYRNGYSTAKDAFIEGAKFADANQPSPWISVEEKLPEPEKEVIVLAKDKYIDIDHLTNDGEDGYYWWKNDETIWCEDDKITHWMPIPELKQQDIVSEVIAYQQEDEEIKRLIDEYSEKFPQGGIGDPLQINTGEMILSKEECEKIRTAVLENKPEVVEEIVVDHAIEFLSKKMRQ